MYILYKLLQKKFAPTYDFRPKAELFLGLEQIQVVFQVVLVDRSWIHNSPKQYKYA